MPCLTLGEVAQTDICLPSDAALLEYREICKLQTPNQRSLEALREWLGRPRCGDYFLRGIEADVWDPDEPAHASDLISMSEVHVDRDGFSRFLAFYIVPLYHRYFHSKVKVSCGTMPRTVTRRSVLTKVCRNQMIPKAGFTAIRNRPS